MKTPHLFKKTKRLIIRPLESTDYENWVQCYSSLQPPLNEWDETNWDSTELTKAKFRSLLAKQKNDLKRDFNYDFGIFRKDDGLLIGTIHVMDVSRGLFQNAYLGYRIFNNFWGHGYAQESCKAIISLAFRELKLHRIEAGIAPENKKSIKTAMKIGMRKEGLSKRRLLVNKKWTDTLIFALTREDSI
jgi:ribosomal-protein-alanine N-acetyltransferase